MSGSLNFKWPTAIDNGNTAMYQASVRRFGTDYNLDVIIIDDDGYRTIVVKDVKYVR